MADARSGKGAPGNTTHSEMDLRWGEPPTQGALGDCWLIAVLETLWANWPQVLRRMVRPLPNGQFEVRMARGTVWVNPVFGSNTAQPVWAACIEKAISILLGGYIQMEGNTIKYACDLLLPKYVLSYIPNSISIIPTPRGYHALHPNQCFILHILPRNS